MFVSSIQTIRSVKELLRRQFGYAPKAQTLLLEGKTLADDHNFRDYDINYSATIRLTLRLGKSSQIHVKTCKLSHAMPCMVAEYTLSDDNNHLVLDAQLEGPVDNLMRLVATMTGVNAFTHRLVFRGKPLDSGDCTIAFYGVQANDTLVLARKPQINEDGDLPVPSLAFKSMPPSSFGPGVFKFQPSSYSDGPRLPKPPSPQPSRNIAAQPMLASHQPNQPQLRPKAPARLSGLSETPSDSDDNNNDGLFQVPVRASDRSSDAVKRPTLSLGHRVAFSGERSSHAGHDVEADDSESNDSRWNLDTDLSNMEGTVGGHFGTAPGTSHALSWTGADEKVEDSSFGAATRLVRRKPPPAPTTSGTITKANALCRKAGDKIKSDLVGWAPSDPWAAKKGGDEKTGADDSASADSNITEVRQVESHAEDDLVDDLIAK